MTPKEIFDLIPDNIFEILQSKTEIDRKVHYLTGKIMFQLVLYSLITTNKGSLRVMETIFNSVRFKNWTQADDAGRKRMTKYNSIYARICSIDSHYFSKLFDECYDLFQKQINKAGSKGPKILRFDSTMVAASGKLMKIGMKVGSKTDKKQIKFSIGFDGLMPRSGQIFTEQQHLSEDITLRKAILDSTVAKDEIVVFDRGVQKRSTYEEFSQNLISFVTRVNTSTQYTVVENLVIPSDNGDECEIISDQMVRLYDSKKRAIKNPLRLVVISASNTGNQYWFLTNIREMTAKEIAEIYKRRWDIEVFFKFLKQELNFSHLVAGNENGIRVMMYISLITAMLIEVYKYFNKLKGYKIAKLKFSLEMEEELIKQIVIMCGGDPSKLIVPTG